MDLHAHDERVRIRRMTADDAPALYAAVRESIEELCQWMNWCRPEYSLEESRKFAADSAEAWVKNEEYNFAIIDAADGAVLGTVGLNQFNRQDQFANLGYWVRTSRTRQGVAPVAARLAAAFGLKAQGFRRLEIVVETNNTYSQRVAEKVGARREGVMRNRLMNHGESRDAVMYSLVTEDLER